MPEIRNLNSIELPAMSDLLPVYSQQNGATRKLSFGNLLNWLKTSFMSPEPKTVVSVGDDVTFQVPNNMHRLWCIFKPENAASHGTANIYLPADAVDGNEAVFNLAGNYAVSVYLNATSETVTDSTFKYRFCGLDNTWYRSL